MPLDEHNPRWLLWLFRLHPSQPQSKTGGIHAQDITCRRIGGRVDRSTTAGAGADHDDHATGITHKQPAEPEKQAKKKRPMTPGMVAAHERLKKCGAEWKEAKAAVKIEKGMKWSKYWSACNKHLKAAG